ncbi:cysteine hydrolase family protein [Pelagibius sp. Alg239-R121]|uniref:cysteine hydrolase family protein n=1 Tax=Pelagibius sp. Alg239-R121 TaxID=2993448 RepID=UPI0024A628C9|nr:cysteine hydrolase [Pelagibius sp. Alg239-R121]
MRNHCLIIIDMLHDFLDQWEADRRDRLIESTNRLIEAFRVFALPVLWVRQEFEPDLSDAFLDMRDKQISITIKGTRGSQIHSDLAFESGDMTVIKKRYSAFFQTELDEVLKDLGVTAPVLAGVNTHACIRMAAIDAYQRDMRVVLAADCIGSYDNEHAQVSLKYMDGKIASVTTSDQIIAKLNRTSA